MVAFGTGPKVSLQELRNVLMWQENMTSVFTAQWNLMQLGICLSLKQLRWTVISYSLVSIADALNK